MAAESEDGLWCREMRSGVSVRGGGDGGDGRLEEEERVAFSHRHSRTSTVLEAIRRIKRHRAAAAAWRGIGARDGRGDEGDVGHDGADIKKRIIDPEEEDGGTNAAASAGFHSGDGTLRLLLVGADRVEGTSPLETAEVFKGLLRRSKRRRSRSRGWGGGGGSSGGGRVSGTKPPQPKPRAEEEDDNDEEEEEEEDVMEGIHRVDVLLVGPNVMLNEGVREGVFHAVQAAPQSSSTSGLHLHPHQRGQEQEQEQEQEQGEDEQRGDHRRIQIRVAYHIGLYHDMQRRGSCDDDGDDDDDNDRDRDSRAVASGVTGAAAGASSASVAAAAADDVGSFTPDLAVAFNAGMWGYSPEEWRPTVRRVLHDDKCPLVVTGYTLEIFRRHRERVSMVGPWLEETENDEDALRDMVGSCAPPLSRAAEGEMHGGAADIEVGASGSSGAAWDGSKGRGAEAEAGAGAGAGAGTEGEGEGEGAKERTSRGGALRASQPESESKTVAWLWEAELNPSRSLQKRQLHFDGGVYMKETVSFMGENCGWQCLVGRAAAGAAAAEPFSGDR